jgi:hypothetical protein
MGKRNEKRKVKMEMYRFEYCSITPFHFKAIVNNQSGLGSGLEKMQQQLSWIQARLGRC